jgi:hypothetical protein
MTRDYEYCFDGIHPTRLAAGEATNVPEETAKIWLAEGKAEQDKMVDLVPERKVNPREGEQAHHAGPNVTIQVERGTSPYEVPPPGVVPTKPVLAKKKK